MCFHRDPDATSTDGKFATKPVIWSDWSKFLENSEDCRWQGRGFACRHQEWRQGDYSNGLRRSRKEWLRRLPRDVPREIERLTAAFAAILLTLGSFAARAEDADPVARGAYLAAAAGCDQCHTDAKNGGPPYGGGRALETPFGTIVTPNITPDRETGIGRWGLADFTRALRWGIAPDNFALSAGFSICLL